MWAAISEGTWAFLAVLVTNVVILIGLFYRQGKQGAAVELINKAVNHQTADEEGHDKPTLIQRMVKVEKRTEEIAEDTRRHRDWQYRVFTMLGAHVGFVVPHHEDEGEYSSVHE